MLYPPMRRLPFFVLFRSVLPVFPDGHTVSSSAKPIAHAIAVHNNRHDQRSACDGERLFFEIFHEQLPLPVPCYDLLPVIEFTLGPRKARFRVLPTSLS